MTVSLARHALIAMAVILGPVWLSIYGLWIWIGSRMDRAGQRRTSRILKGRSATAA